MILLSTPELLREAQSLYSRLENKKGDGLLGSGIALSQFGA
jgi:hypothetical protein